MVPWPWLEVGLLGPYSLQYACNALLFLFSALTFLDRIACVECKDVASCYRCSVVYLCVCLSVEHKCEPWKNGLTDRDAVWIVDSGRPKEP